MGNWVDRMKEQHGGWKKGRPSVREVVDFLSGFAEEAEVYGYQGEGGSWLVVVDPFKDDLQLGELNTNEDRGRSV